MRLWQKKMGQTICSAEDVHSSNDVRGTPKIATAIFPTIILYYITIER